ncbi:hypothetical protein BRYFOR_09444 [Marvinbryantia formatexigens DSM 14469]|uniref:Gylcosyl hydrolase 115 C-terminal domain-containing protein n=1 Tax=Marvinbryantia formatexigens DSM 14469 TaxID=478749 RepID=C6LL97_9FIRM|nr:glycosyl hydrolase 115 family protein [Marvinbryantia formatexigens]EET58608.1 hypothetical protein BRYFOR_09444 [Marvinbryantia formatexigens DSM 14469]UWO25504.1 glycosyl hydrolase 115 family protein [Marvinbryantia formatexigens DSM 14469]SDG92344.1 Glycosyl hydrolase family 115 [Marvinbryantia formatexigens]
MAYLKFSKDTTINIILDAQAGPGICRIREKVAKDIRETTGACVQCGAEGGSNQAVLAATLGEGTLADTLTERIPELKTLAGRWESYGFYLAEQPLEGVERALVIVGSDRTGTIYGMFHLSELLGVTATGFWGDVTPPAWESALLTDETETEGAQDGHLVKRVTGGISKEPSVKFRGFFINDEWPCYGNWTFSHYQGFTAEMYDHVFEYLLRMKGNYLWPAMWTSSFLLDGPGLSSMQLATEYGIYIGMSHHEPCMRSGEEFSIFKGENSPYGTEWNYDVNKEGLLKFWEDGLTRVKDEQIFPTVGMRGERDSKLLGDDATIAENVRQLKEIITNQRKLIAQHVNPDLKKVPQLFAIYKEVEDYYFGDGRIAGIRGFEELEDVTLLFCEDNFGSMRALPQGAERQHPGGFGMYYHVDYHGSPISFEWVNSTPLVRIWEQMSEAYEYGVRNLWIVNVGDVKFQEYPLGYFMELAYDFETWGGGSSEKVREYTAQWIQKQFGAYASEEQCRDITWVLEEAVRLAGYRRPEALNDTVYHPAHYNEGRRMLKRCEALEQKTEQLLAELSGTPAEKGYFSMIYYPAAGIANLLKMHLTSGMNHLYASQGRAVANVYGQQMQACIEKDAALAARMREFNGGKWSGMELEQHIGFVNWNDEDWRYPVQHVLTLPQKPRLTVSRADGTGSYTNQYFPKPLVIDDFCYAGKEKVTIQIANGGTGSVEWKISGACDCLEFSAREGSTELLDEVEITFLREKLPVGQSAECECRISTETEYVPLRILCRNESLAAVPFGAYVMQNGLCAADAAGFSVKFGGMCADGRAAFEKLEDYGKYGSGMKVFPTTAVYKKADWEDGSAPSLLYEIWAEEEQDCILELRTSPANPLVNGGLLQTGVRVNEEEIQTLTLTGPDYRGGDPDCEAWCTAVLDQEHRAELPVHIRKGVNKITLYAGDAGVVLERLLVYAPDKKPLPSYMGPETSFRKQ